MESQIKPPDVYITDTGTALGRGVFAARAFSINEIVETCPVVLSDDSFELLPTELQHRIFDWSRLTKSRIRHALALGYGSLYNHSDTPNLRYEADENTNTIQFIAIRDISASEQLFISYNQGLETTPQQNTDWFKKNKVKKI